MLTGATGFIGSHVADRLLARGVDLHLWVRRKTERIKSFEARGAHLHIGPQNNIQMLAKPLQLLDTVIHCAGAVRALTQADYCRANVDLTFSLLNLLNSGQRFIYISSQAAAGPSSCKRPLEEDGVPRPITHYGKSKLKAEAEVIRWGQGHQNNYIILRPCTVYGPRDKLILSVFKLLKTGICPQVSGGIQAVSLVHVDDLVAAIMCATAASCKGEIYFVADDKNYLVREIFACMGAALGQKRLHKIKVPITIVRLVARLSDAFCRTIRRPGLLDRQRAKELSQKAWLCSSQKIQKDLNWRPSVSLGSGMQRTVDWYRQAGRL